MQPVSLTELTSAVHTALRLWHQANDDTSPLAGLYLFRQARGDQPGQARRVGNELLHQALTGLARDYDPGLADLLRFRFLEKTPIAEISGRLNLAEPTLHRKQRQAIEQLAAILVELEQQARGSALTRLEQRLKLPAATRLFGIESLLEQVTGLLSSPEPAWLLALEGIGGIGKTALAAAVVRELALSPRFEQVAWVSAQQHEFWPGLGIQPTGRPLLDRESLVERLVEQLEAEPAQGFSPAQKLAALTQRLKQQPHLVVIDNLESSAEAQTLLPLLQHLANPTKFLLTTRIMPPRAEVGRVPLTELSRTATLALLKHEASLRQMPALAQASPDQLERIYDVVGGNPLALKLVVGQLHSLSLATVLENLKQAQGQKVEALYTFIYRQAWQTLNEAARQVLLLMPLAQNGTASQLAAAAGNLAEAQLADALEHLTAVSLLEVSGDLAQRRYRIHRLTETFLLNEVIKWQTAP